MIFQPIAGNGHDAPARAGQAAACTKLIPVFTLLFGVSLLHEVFLPSQYLASALIIAGVLLSQWRAAPARREGARG
ncbi:EamA family transporter [uncultured Desulfovibrio sp.]|uniref:EamA family transporter n=1 Tax=uncultured Desulfovibrio sp. TaxID=167968 RepID=UPI003431C1C8